MKKGMNEPFNQMVLAQLDMHILKNEPQPLPHQSQKLTQNRS